MAMRYRAEVVFSVLVLTLLSLALLAYAAAPSVTTLSMTSSDPLNRSHGNLTASVTVTDGDADPVAVAYDWRINGTSYAVLQMHFDVNNSNGTGSTRDYSSFGTNGSVIGPEWNATGGVNGTAAYFFDGTGDRIEIPDAPSLEFTSSFTIAAWINTNGLPGAGEWDGIVTKGGNGEAATSNHNYLLTLENGVFGTGPAVAFGFENAAGTNYVTRYNETALSTGRWYHLTGVFDDAANNVTLYIDGAYVASAAAAGTPNTQNNATAIGENQVSGTINYFAGHIDDVRIYNRSLSAAQVVMLAANRTYQVAYQETSASQNWSVCVTPNDGTTDGAMNCTKGLVVADGCPSADGNWVVPVSTTRSANVVCDTINVTNGSTLTLQNNITVRATQWVAVENGTVTSDVMGRVNITAANITFTENAMINVTGMGFPGGAADSDGFGYGNGSFGTNSVGPDGASHGGNGGVGKYRSVWNVRTYGNITHPLAPGSGGGGGGGSAGSNGGGIVYLNATDTLINNGTILANAQTLGDVSFGRGGGAGGSVLILTNTFAGNGTITAKGGRGACDTSIDDNDGGGGGGGRVAAHYGVNSYAGTLSAVGGSGCGGGSSGGAGTVYRKDLTTGEDTLVISNTGISTTAGTNISAGTSPSSYTHLELSNATVMGVTLSIQRNVTIRPGTTFLDLAIIGPADMIVESGAILRHSPYNDSTPANLNLTVGNLTITSGGSINLTAQGYAGVASFDGLGYGNGSERQGLGLGPDGASHGGNGGLGNGRTIENVRTYGNLTNPTTAGSGGGAWSSNPGGSGGGILILNVTGTLNNTGGIEASGNGGTTGDGTGGGAGGSIWIVAANITGSGTIEARGGWGTHDGTTDDADGGAGGGGRIAIYYTDIGTYTGTINATGGKLISGAGSPGGAGTIYLKDLMTGDDTLLITNAGVNANAKTNLSVGTGSYDYRYLNISDAYITGETLRTARVTVLSSQVTSESAFDLPSNLTVLDGANVQVNNTVNATVITIRAGSKARFNAAMSVSRMLNMTGANFSIFSSFRVLGDLNITQNSRLGTAANATFANATIDGSILSTNQTVTAQRMDLKNTTWTMNQSATMTNLTLQNATILSPILSSINITAAGIIIDSGSVINATGLGYRGGSAANTIGNGPGNSSGQSSVGSGGASHGGAGGLGSGNGAAGTVIYGDLFAPVTYGSGSGGADAAGGAGGGVIVLNATGTINVTGVISSDGAKGTPVTNSDAPGGGAGGSIWLVANAIVGSGTISATGAPGQDGGTNDEGGGGGGGRISLNYRSSSFSGTFDVGGISAVGTGSAGNAGTLFLCQYDKNTTCPGSLGAIILSTTLASNASMNLTRNLTTDWNDTRIMWNETSTNGTLLASYIIQTLTYPNYKVYRNSTFNNSVLVDANATRPFSMEIGSVYLDVRAPNNTLPSQFNITLNGSRNDPDVLYASENLLCSVNATDTDDFNVTAYWVMYNGSVVYNQSSRSILADGSWHLLTNVSDTVINKAETWTCQVAVGDTYGNLTARNLSRTTEANVPPVIAGANITPLVPYTNETILGWCNGTEPEGEFVFYHYTWYRNGTFHSSGAADNGGQNYTAGVFVNVANISTATTIKNEYWTLQCIVQDAAPLASANSTGTINSTNVTILNFVPNATVVVVNSSRGFNVTTENLTAYPTIVLDPDQDTVGVLYDWRRNGTSIAILNMNFDLNNSGGTGKTRDYSTRMQNGTVGRGTNWNATGGRNGTGAYEFNGSHGNISVALVHIDNITVSAWFKTRNKNADQKIVSRTENGEYQLGLTTCSGTQGVCLLVYVGGVLYYAGADINNISNDQWYHAVGTYDGETARLYLDGVLMGWTPIPSGAITTHASAPICIGSESAASGSCLGGSVFNGTIDDVLILNRSLNEQEVLALYRNQTGVLAPYQTGAGDNWSVCTSVNDGQNETAPLCSEGLLITPSQSPTVASAIVRSQNGQNSTNEDLNVTVVTSDPEGDTVRTTIDWRINGTSIAVVNMPFDIGGNNGSGSIGGYTSWGDNATVSGATWMPVSGVGGSGAFMFDGVNDYLNLTNKSHLNLAATNAFTLAAWVNPATMPPGTGIITEQYTGAGDRIQYELGFGLSTATTAVPQVGFWNTSHWITSTYGTLPANKTWTHYAGTWNGTHLNLYVNGALVNSTAYPANTMSAAGVQEYWIGRRHDNTGTYDFFPGLIDEVLILNRSLTSEQIAYLAQNRTDRIAAPELRSGENWSACVRPNDGYTEGATICSQGLAIAEGSITTREASITPTAPYTSDTLLGWCNATGSATTVSYHYLWYRNGTLNTSGYNDNGGENYTVGLLVNVANISAAGTTRSENWTFSCLASDSGINSTQWITSSTLTILNSPPSISTIIVNSTNRFNASIGNLTAYATVNDNDSDTTRTTYDWRVNGTSIAVLNMDFDVNNSNGTGKVRDYSSFNNNASNTGAVWEQTGGHDGTGSFYFTNDYLDLQSTISLPGDFTILFWEKMDAGLSNDDAVVGQSSANSINHFGSKIRIFGASSDRIVAAANTPTGVWVQYAFVRNGTALRIYTNGSQTDSNSAGAGWTFSIDFIGSGTAGQIDGRLDSLMIFNRSLSFDEILAIYNNRTDLIVTNETRADQNWTACATSNDGLAEGATRCSDGIVVASLVPVTHTSRISPAPSASVTDTIIGYCNATSPGDEFVSYNYTWYKRNSTDSVVLYSGQVFRAGSVSAGTDHTCGIRASDGRVLCWGLGTNGRLGFGNTSTILKPTLINDTGAYIQVDAGDTHTCGIRAADRRILCWGENTNGEMGNGSQGGNALNPQLINDTAAYANLSVGYNFACAIRRNDSRVLCWGDNSQGQIGDGTTIDRNLTTLTTDITNQSLVTAGQYHACTIRANDGRGMCWGYNGFGQLGIGNSSNVYKPALVRNTTSFIEIDAGGSHTCGISRNTSRVLCWGSYVNYEIGNGSGGAGGLYAYNATYTSDTSAYSKIAAGALKSCGIRANDSLVLCWGQNASGGFDTTPKLRADASAYLSISAGHHVCATRRNDSRILCWGDNTNGEIGDGTSTTPRNPPTLTTDASPYGIGFISGTEQLVSNLTMSLVTSGDNVTLTCWPTNIYGYGTAMNSSVTSILGVLNVTAASITPTVAYTGTDLLGWCNGTNTDPNAVSYHYAWFRDGSINTTGYATNGGGGYTAGLLVNVANITGSTIAKGQNWTLSCLVTDGPFNSSWRNSTGLVVNNSLPVIASLVVNSTAGTNTTGENLTAYATGLSDADADTVRVTYDWRVNGTSLALLNMPFDTNNSPSTTKTRDHSTFGRNGTHSAGAWNATGGWNGSGAIRFNGSTSVSASAAELGMANFTFEAVIRLEKNTSVYPIISKYLESSDAACGIDGGWAWYASGSQLCLKDTQGYTVCANASLTNTSWHHVVTSRSGTRLLFFVDGTLISNQTYHANSLSSSTEISIGYWDAGNVTYEFSYHDYDCDCNEGDCGTYFPQCDVYACNSYPNNTYFNGSIDNLRIYNRSLSSAQIALLAANRTDMIASQELALGQNWTACATPSDAQSDGATTCSAGLLITAAVGGGDSCTPPAIGNNWLVYAADNCTKTNTAIDLGTGNLTVTGEQGPGYLRFVTANITASNINVVGHGNLSRIYLEAGARAAIS